MTTEPSPARLNGNELIAEHALGEVRTFIDELKNGTKKYRTIASLGGQIAEAYRGRCVLELLQNAHDALVETAEGDPGLLTFSLKTEPEPVLLVANSGRAFERKDFKGLCQLGQSPKDPNKSVGNKGLGFRSVLEVASGPEIWSTATTEEGTAYVFRFDPAICGEVAAAIAALNESGLAARSPFDPSLPVVDWTEDQLERYRDRLSGDHVDAPGEAKRFLSPYDIPLPIKGRCAAVDDLLRAGHATVIRLPLDGGRGGSVEEATASVKVQLEGLLDLSMTLFLPRLKELIVDIDGDRSVVRRIVDAEDTLNGLGRGRRQTVSISRIRPTCDEDATGRFRVWTRALGGEADAEWAERIRGAVQHLPNKWPDVDRAEVGVSVREGPKPDEGKFVIFLPTEMATGTGASINAPFFGTLDRRRIEFKDAYNTLLLRCIADLCLDAIDDLLDGEPENLRGRALVDILGAWGEVGDTGQSMLELVGERAAARNRELDDRALLLCDDGWTSVVKARAMPGVADGLAIGAVDWRRAAAFPVVSRALDGRESGVQALVEGLDGSLTPTDSEWSHTVESVAGLVQSGEIDATWDGFLTSLLEVLPSELVWKPRADTEDALKSARFLPNQDGRLISASDEARVFFQPVIGIDDAADLVDTVPNSLKQRIAFVHRDVRTHEEGSRRPRTALHKFLDDRFAGGFGREKIVRDVVLGAVPPLPAALDSGDGDLCAELLGWTMRLLGDEPSEALLSLLSGLPVACHGGWHRADEAVFGPGWPERNGDNLWELAEELGGTMAHRLRRTALLRPDDPRWRLEVGPRDGLFERIGVTEGLRLSPVNEIRFWMQMSDYELPCEAPADVDQKAWDGWRAGARQEAKPRHQSLFEYSLESVYWLPELHGVETLSRRGRRALSRLVLDSVRCWPSGWEQATVRKVVGEWNTWRITSPVKHWLSTLPWLVDGSSSERPLSERWLVPISLLRGQQDRFRHLRPLTLDLCRKLEADPELAGTLKGLELNVYPTDGQRIGPELLNVLAAAWRAQPELAARFNIILNQVRHAWQHFDESDELPNEFLIWTAPRRFEVLDGDSLRDLFLPDDAEKGRSVRESGKGVLEMPVRVANRLAALLVEATSIRRASALEERILIDGTEWTGASDGVSSLEDTRFSWLPAPLLAIAAHGGTNPTGAATQGWTASVGRLRASGVVECESIVVELVAGAESVAESAPPAWWLPGDVLAVTRQTATAYDKLAPALQAMLHRQDLLKDLRLVLGAVGGIEAPSVEDIEGALDLAEIDAQAFADVRSHWAGNAGLLASRIRPVAELLGVAMEEFESAALDADGFIEWLANNVPQWETRKLISAARRSRDDHAMGLEAWRALGDVAQLPAWNAVLERLGDEYEPVENKHADDQTSAHLEAMRPLLQAVSRHIAISAGDSELFPRFEAATGDFTATDSWSKRWWHVPFPDVLDALFRRWGQEVKEFDSEALPRAASVGDLRGALVEKRVEIDFEPYETARVNKERFGKALLEVHDLHRTWVEVQTPKAEVPDRPAPTDLGAEAYLRRLSEAELWRRALAVLRDKRFIAACGDFAQPSEVKERLGIDEAAIAARRCARSEQEKEAARKPKKMEIAGASFEIETIDYAELLREHIDGLQEPTGPRARDDEFTPLGTLGARAGSRGGGGTKRRSLHRPPSREEDMVVGVVGEMHAYRYLRKEFGERSVQARAWVSQTRLKVLPLVEGEPNETSDGHGFDFRFSHGGIRWRVEVKATRGNEPSFNLGISEIRAATDIARRRNDRLRWRILRVRNALSQHPEFDWLPNPFEDGFRNRFRLHQGGMLVSYVRRQD